MVEIVHRLFWDVLIIPQPLLSAVPAHSNGRDADLGALTEISPLRFASVEMTKSGVTANLGFLNPIFIPCCHGLWETQMYMLR